MAPRGKKKLCLAELSSDQLTKVLEFIQWGYDNTRIAKIIQGAWGACTDVTHDTVRHAVAILNKEICGSQDEEIETEKEVIPASEPQTETAPQITMQPSTNPQLPIPSPPPTQYQSHNPVGSIFSLIQTQFNRLKSLLQTEQAEGQPIPEIGRIVESIKGLNREFVSMSETLNHGKDNSPESQKAKVVVQQMNVMVQQLQNRETVAEVAMSFSKNLESLAVPMLMEGQTDEAGEIDIEDVPVAQDESIIDITTEINEPSTDDPINEKELDTIDVHEQTDLLPQFPRRRGRPPKTADDHERDADNKSVGANSKSRARVKKLLSDKKSKRT